MSTLLREKHKCRIDEDEKYSRRPYPEHWKLRHDNTSRQKCAEDAKRERLVMLHGKLLHGCADCSATKFNWQKNLLETLVFMQSLITISIAGFLPKETVHFIRDEGPTFNSVDLNGTSCANRTTTRTVNEAFQYARTKKMQPEPVQTGGGREIQKQPKQRGRVVTVRRTGRVS